MVYIENAGKTNLFYSGIKREIVGGPPCLNRSMNIPQPEGKELICVLILKHFCSTPSGIDEKEE